MVVWEEVAGTFLQKSEDTARPSIVIDGGMAMLFATFRAEKRFDPRDLIRKTAVRIYFFTCVILFETTTLPGQNVYYFWPFCHGTKFPWHAWYRNTGRPNRSDFHHGIRWVRYLAEGDLALHAGTVMVFTRAFI